MKASDCIMNKMKMPRPGGEAFFVKIFGEKIICIDKHFERIQ